MLVSTMKPQPASGVHADRSGYAAGDIRPRAVDEHGEADEDLRRPAAVGIDRRHLRRRTAARHIDHPRTSMSSSAQPVNGTAPVTPVRLSVGVSTMPNGLADVPFG